MARRAITYVMLLSGPCGSLKIVDRWDVSAPACFAGHLVELAILNHHGVNDAQERLVRREESCSTSQGVPLEKALTLVFGQCLNDTTTPSIAELIPLKVSIRAIEDFAEFVRLELVRGENTECLRVSLYDTFEEVTDTLHG